MSDGWADTPEAGQQQGQPVDPATPPQGAAADPAFPHHDQQAAQQQVQQQVPPQQQVQQPYPGQQQLGGFPPLAQQQQPQQPQQQFPGYGYGQQQPQDAYNLQAPQSGYGYPHPQSGYGYPPAGPAVAEPNWQSMADQAEATARKRKLRIGIGVGVVVAALIAGGVTFALTSGKPDKKPVALPSASPSPSPTINGPKTAVEVLSDVKYDGSSTDESKLFPLDHITINGHNYIRTATESTKAGGCDQPVTPDLGTVLVANECIQLHRATYLNGNVGVTLGIAEFTSSALADKVKANATGSLLSLSGAKTTPAFCRGVTCLTSQNSFGRFAYFTIAGQTNNSAAVAGDTVSLQAGRDLADYAHALLLARGEAELAVLQKEGLAPLPSPSPSASVSPSASATKH
ncbi:hypothetical protein [Kitasatospora sp. MMS16-BH015]|uniref:hypothetical protein n=1 Tax=Kitasatospora sp. MMS16-BH015 TaxID=2018025 RepID=UPI00131A5E92|nr:hypothetical protein [Kitasatospora sp. MMS16-BH015]